MITKNISRKKNNVPEVTSSLDSWLVYLENLHYKSIDMGLSRVSKVAERLGVLQPAPFVFTVTGTNGKGTTCRILELILIASGYKVGVYTSPHLMHYTERNRIQNTELSESEHIASFIEIEEARGNISLTYFEYSTLSALWLFKKAQLDVVILEVGLGGRLDATNIVNSDVAVVTNIALDHTKLLGSDRESIGREKAGIFRSGKPAIVGELKIPQTVVWAAKEKNANLLRYGCEWKYSVSNKDWSFTDAFGQLNNLPLPQIPQSNAATALAAVRAGNLIVSEQAIRSGIHDAILPGRFQIISEYPRVILDVAHNPHAAAYLVKKFASLPPRTGQVSAIVGMLYDKDISGTLSCIGSLVDHWYCATLEVPRGASAKQLVEYLSSGRIYSSVEEAWFAAINDVKEEDTILVCGSFHAVSSIMRIIHSGNINTK